MSEPTPEQIIEAWRQMQEAAMHAWQAIVEQAQIIVRAVVSWMRRNYPVIREIRRAFGLRKPTIMTRKIQRYVRSW